MTAIIAFVAGFPGLVLRGLEWMAGHPAVAAVVALGAVTLAVAFYINVRSWRRK